MRRITTGIGGGPVLGTFTALENNLQTIETNTDIVLDPNGSGEIKENAHMQVNAGGSFKFADADSSNYVAFKAPSTVSSNVTWTLPTGDGTNGQVLKTDGSGNLTFTDPGITTSNQTADTGTYYVAIMDDADANDGLVTGVNYSSGKLYYQPSTGTLTSTVVSAGTLNSSAGTFTGKHTVYFDGGSDLTNSTSMFEIQDTGGTTAPSMAFHRPGSYAMKLQLWTDNKFYFGGWSAGAGGAPIVSGTHEPGANNSYDLGSSSLRWRTIYTTDLELSNGIGDYTVVEGEEDLFLYNNKTNKTFKFMLQEVDPSVVPPKKAATPEVDVDGEE